MEYFSKLMEYFLKLVTYSPKLITIFFWFFLTPLQCLHFSLRI